MFRSVALVGDVTQLLSRARQGDGSALNELVPLVYAELRRIADGYLRQEKPNHTLQPTALVNEACLRLIGDHQPNYLNRTHFLGVATYLMRQVLTDHARRRHASKRGHGVPALALNEGIDFFPERASIVIALDDALTTLATIHPDQARLVELRFYDERSQSEIAEIVGVSQMHVSRLLRQAMEQLGQVLRESDDNVASVHGPDGPPTG